MKDIEAYHSDPVADGFGREVAGELGPDHAAVSVGAGHFAPDHTGLIGFTSRSHCVPEKQGRTPLEPDRPGFCLSSVPTSCSSLC